MEIISECFVKPKQQVEAIKNRINLRTLDLCMLSRHPIQNGLVFAIDQPNPETIVTILDNLKHSLSIALIHFYPLAGRLATETFPDEHACTVFIDCNKGLGARLTHVAAKNVRLLDIVSPTCVPLIVRELFDLGDKFVNYDSHTRPLLSIQVTELVDGLFIGFTVNHCVVDGTSCMHFINMLSEIFCSENNSSEKSLEVSQVPVIEYVPLLKLPYLGLEEVMIWRNVGSSSRDRIFSFSSKSLAMLKAKTNQGRTIHKVSTFKCLASLIWRSITRARNLSPDQETACCVMINARNRLEPPLSDNYVGNFVTQAKVTCKVEELLSRDLGWAAMRLSDAIAAENNTSIHGIWNFIAGQISTKGFQNLNEEYFGPNRVVIGGSTRFDMYGVDLGLGKAVAAFRGYGNKNDGKVMAGSGREGGGSVDLEISLKEEHMAALEADPEFMTYVVS